MSTFNPQTINIVWAPIIFGLIGIGGSLLPSQVTFNAITPDDLIGISVALSVILRVIGLVLRKSILYNIFHHVLMSKAVRIIAHPALAANLTTVLEITAVVLQMTAGPLQYYIAEGWFPEMKQSAFPALITAGRELYAKCFATLYLVSIPFGALAILSSFMLWGVEDFIDEHTAVVLHG